MSTLASDIPDFLQGGHAMGERIRAFDWGAHPLGPPRTWPLALQMAMSLCLNSSFPTAIYWGPQLYTLYNDAWSEIPAERHPAALGKPARELWADIWHVVGPQFEQVFSTGEGLALYEQLLPMVRHGLPRETWWNYSFTALRNPDNSIGGIYNQGNEVTRAVLARRERQAEVERWRDLFRQAPAPVALLSGPQHVFEIANDAYRKLIGGRDVLGKTVAQALPEVQDQGFVELLDKVYASGEPYVGSSVDVQIQRSPGGPIEDSVLDFIYQPVRDAGGMVEGIFVLVTDVTDRARAESQLRITNWQLAEERARLAALVEAEQRAQAALRKFNETLEANVRQHTAELDRTLEAQAAIAARLRASFESAIAHQAFLDKSGTLLDANGTSLAAIGARLQDVLGAKFWEAPWFSLTPGMPRFVQDACARASRGDEVRATVELKLPAGVRTFDLSLRPVLDGRREVAGIVSEALDITDRPTSAASSPAGGPSRAVAAP